jgi:hypothetical protein
LNLGELVLEKMEIDEYFFGKNLGKLAHLQNLAPKIIYGRDYRYFSVIFQWYHPPHIRNS